MSVKSARQLVRPEAYWSDWNLWPYTMRFPLRYPRDRNGRMASPVDAGAFDGQRIVQHPRFLPDT
jgi:hypothetical protein